MVSTLIYREEYCDDYMKIFRDEIKTEWTSNDAGYENSEPTSNCTLRHVLAVWKVSLQNPYIAH